MNPTPNQKRIIALDIRSRSFGFAVFEGSDRLLVHPWSRDNGPSPDGGGTSACRRNDASNSGPSTAPGGGRRGDVCRGREQAAKGAVLAQSPEGRAEPEEAGDLAARVSALGVIDTLSIQHR
jgi:hypothetical protein